MPEPQPADPRALASLVRAALPGARSVEVTPASGGRLVVVYRAVADGVPYYLRLAEPAPAGRPA